MHGSLIWRQVNKRSTLLLYIHSRDRILLWNHSITVKLCNNTYINTSNKSDMHDNNSRITISNNGNNIVPCYKIKLAEDFFLSACFEDNTRGMVVFSQGAVLVRTNHQSWQLGGNGQYHDRCLWDCIAIPGTVRIKSKNRSTRARCYDICSPPPLPPKEGQTPLGWKACYIFWFGRFILGSHHFTRACLSKLSFRHRVFFLFIGRKSK